MKKIIFVALAALMSTGAFAQNFQWGVKAGLNLATISDFDDAKMKPGLVAGVFGEYVISDFFGIKGELLYSMQGVKQEYVIDDIDVKSQYKLDYIVLPILAEFYVLEGLSVELGPQFGYMVSAKNKIEGGGESETMDLYKNDGLKKFDVAVGMGLNYKFLFGLDIFARYNLGITKIGEDGDGKNNVLQFGLGYRF